MRREKHELPVYPLMGSYLQSKIIKPVKKKKTVNLPNKTEHPRIGTPQFTSVKFLTQEPETSHAPELYKHRRVMSKDRQDQRCKPKSSEHSRRNNSDESKGGGQKSRSLKKKTNL